MSIIIFEGADFTGKTTAISNLIKNEKSSFIYIHFPIMTENDYSEILESAIKKIDLQKSDYENMLILQNKFLFNIIENSKLILDMYNCGFNVYLDRYILSNVVYRSVFGLPDIKIPDICSKILNISRNNHNLHILILPENELFQRMEESNRYKDSLAKLVEKKKIIFAVNKKYSDLILD